MIPYHIMVDDMHRQRICDDIPYPVSGHILMLHDEWVSSDSNTFNISRSDIQEKQNQNIDWNMVIFGVINSLFRSASKPIKFDPSYELDNNIIIAILLYFNWKEYFIINHLETAITNKEYYDTTVYFCSLCDRIIHGNINIYHTNNGIHYWSFRVKSSRGVNIGFTTSNRPHTQSNNDTIKKIPEWKYQSKKILNKFYTLEMWTDLASNNEYIIWTLRVDGKVKQKRISRSKVENTLHIVAELYGESSIELEEYDFSYDDFYFRNDDSLNHCEMEVTNAIKNQCEMKHKMESKLKNDSVGRIPPQTYICFRCKAIGNHWIQHCDLAK
eukprot:470980_1